MIDKTDVLLDAFKDGKRRLILACIWRNEPVNFLALYEHFKLKFTEFQSILKALEKAELILNVSNNKYLPEYKISEMGKKFMDNFSVADFFTWEPYDGDWPIMHWRR